jgi:peptidoglycan/LPS O-acetylase OafA/YrhL
VYSTVDRGSPPGYQGPPVATTVPGEPTDGRSAGQSASARASAGRVPGLDGLRGLAVLAVVLFHSGISWAVGGLVGVDAFFVLSGFLITHLLLTEHARTGRVSLRAFWGRRVRRLLPAGLLLIAGTGVLWRVFAEPSAWSSLRGDAVSALAYVANWHFAFTGQGYFAHDTPPSPLLHLWSLGVEEQFYLVWPILLVLLLGRRPRPRPDGRRSGAGRIRVLLLCVLGALGSTALCFWLYRGGTDTSRLYYGTDTHSAGLLVGAALACLYTRPRAGAAGRHRVLRRRWLRSGLAQLAAAAGLGVLVWTVLTIDGADGWLYRGGFLVVAVAVAAVVSGVLVAPRSILTRLLSVPPLAGLGRISYAVYLWHWPILLLLTSARVGIDGPALFALRMGVTLAAAVTSWFLLERPVLRHRWTRPRLPVVLVPTMVAVVAAAYLLAPLPTNAGERTPDLAALAQLSLQATVPPEPQTPTSPPRILVVGDSVALTLGVGFDDVAKNLGVQFFDFGQVGCGIATGGPLRFRDNFGNVPKECDSFPSYWVGASKWIKPDLVAVMVGRWELVDRYHDGKMRAVGDPEYDAYLSRQLKTGIDALLATGTRVALLTEPCVLPFETANGSPAREDDPARWRRFNALLHDGAAAYPQNKVRIYDDVSDGLCPDGKYLPKSADGQVLRTEDGIHITQAGGDLTGRVLMPKLMEFAREPES